MIKSQEKVIESGRRWMAGTVTDDEYFKEVHRSAIQALATGATRRVLSVLLRILSRP
jgi:hypothetical protein